MKGHAITATGLLAAVLAGAPTGFAAQGDYLEEIVVTAQKREQRLFDVPMSVTAISGEELEQRSIDTLQDLSLAVPGVATRQDGPGSYQVFMRGLTNQYGPGALVGVYLDEVPVTLTGFDQLDLRVMDLERVEILKGPQGTLYGQGSVAGAVRYITRDPELSRFGGYLEGALTTVEDGDTGRSVTGVVNLPVAEDVFALRLAATVEDGGGWIDQPEAGIEDGNDTELANVRLKALWQVNQRVTAEAMVIRHRADTELGLGYEQPDRTVDVAIDPGRELIPKEYDYDLYNLDLTLDLGFAELLSATAYIDHDHQYPFSYKGGPETIFGGVLEGTDERFLTAEQWSQELRLSSFGEQRLEWTVGAFYRDLERDFFAVFDTLFAGSLFPGGEFTQDDTNEELSVFADASFALTDRLEIGAGIRYFEDDRTTFDGATEEEDSFDSVDPRVYASFAVSDNVNVYASVAEGFRSGGFNAGDLPNFEPETVTSYEIGTKARFLDGQFDVELAAYYSDYEDMLRRGLVFVEELQQFQSLTSNIGEAEIKGLEGGVTWRPVETVTVHATFAVLDAEVTEVNADDATNVEGDSIDYVPDVSYTLGGRYDFAWNEDLPGYLRVDFSYRDEVPYIDRTTFPAENVPQFSDKLKLLDARLGMSWNRATFELFGTNLTDQNEYIDPYAAWTNANRTRPRTVGLNVRYDFDR